MKLRSNLAGKQSFRLLKSAVAVLISGLGLLLVGALVQPTEAASGSAAPVGPNVGQQAVYSSVALTEHIYLPLLLKRYPTNSAFGVQMYGSLDPSTGFTRAVESKSGWLRFPVYWDTIEPTNTIPANYNWASLDASVQAVHDSDIQAIFTFEHNPAWAAAKPGGPVTNSADFQEFVGAVVARYPSIHYWEIYNEPDSIQRFGTKGQTYAALLANLYPLIKSANPNAQVVLGGLAMDWFISDGGFFDRNFLSDTLKYCTGTCFDIANFHYYPYYRGTWEPYGHDIIGKANFVSQTLASYHFLRPLFATETGWPNGLKWGNEEWAARYVPKSFSRGLAAGLSATVWFAMLDADTSSPGLLDSTRVPGSLIPRPAYAAYQVLTGLMNGAKYLGAAPVSDPLEGYQFSAFDKRLDLYWYDCPLVKAPLLSGPVDCSNTATLEVSAARVSVIDKFGVESIMNDGDDGVLDGKITLSVGSSPIYIDYNP